MYEVYTIGALKKMHHDKLIPSQYPEANVNRITCGQIAQNHNASQLEFWQKQLHHIEKRLGSNHLHWHLGQALQQKPTAAKRSLNKMIQLYTTLKPM